MPEQHKRPGVISDFILGSQDGIVNVLGVILGVAIASNDFRIILAGGLAATFAESISMGAVAFTTTLADADLYQSEREREYRHIKEAPSLEIAASVEQKQIAEQQAQQAKFVVEQKKQEAEHVRQTAQGSADASVIRANGDADARIIQAQAEAQALGLIAGALKDNPDLLTYQYISRLSPNVQVMLLPSSGTNYLYPLPTLEFPTPSSLPTAEPSPLPTTTP